jgi:hypothetical protein
MFDLGAVYRVLAIRIAIKFGIVLLASAAIGVTLFSCSRAEAPAKEVTTKTEGIPNRDVFVCGSLAVHRWHDDEKAVTCWIPELTAG